MNEPAQARAYAAADFEIPHSAFISNLATHYPRISPSNILELGCGNGDITWRLAQHFPHARIDAIDGAAAMLTLAEQLLQQKGYRDQVQFIECHLPNRDLKTHYYDAIICNATLHHFIDPQTLWQTIHQCSKQGAVIFIMDLLRPSNSAAASHIVKRDAADASELLKTDFYNSLLAAYNIAEVEQQLIDSPLGTLSVTSPDENHLLIHGLI